MVECTSDSDYLLPTLEEFFIPFGAWLGKCATDCYSTMKHLEPLSHYARPLLQRLGTGYIEPLLHHIHTMSSFFLFSSTLRRNLHSICYYLFICKASFRWICVRGQLGWAGDQTQKCVVPLSLTDSRRFRKQIKISMISIHPIQFFRVVL